MIELGKTYVDKITGYEGVATGRTEYLHGSAAVQLQAPCTGGSIPHPEWVDEARLAPADPKQFGFVRPTGPQSLVVPDPGGPAYEVPPEGTTHQ